MRPDIALLDLIDHPVFMLEPDAIGHPRYVAFNAFALSILRRPIEDIVGKTAAELFPGHLGDTAFRHHKKALLTGVAKSYEIMLPIGSNHKLIRTSLRPVLDDAGRTIRVIGTSKDVTGDRVARELKNSIDSFQRDMEDVINQAAQDLQTPMQNISVIADMLRDGFQDLGDGKLELIDLMEDVGKKAVSLIDDVLRHTDVADSVAEKSDFSLLDLLGDIRVLVDPLQTCRVEATPCRVRADRQAVSNVLKSVLATIVARTDGQERGATPPMNVTLSAASPRRGTLDFVLQDPGPVAIAGTAGPETSQVRDTDGGFGLIGTRRMLRASGGSIMVDPLPDGRGSLVRFSVPGVVVAMENPVAAGVRAS